MFFPRFQTWWRLVLLTGVAGLVCSVHYGWWTPARWSVPAEYTGESLEILARIKAASEGDLAPLRPQVMSRLGAPFGANWSAYPSSDMLLVWTLGQVARVTGVAVAANLALLLAVLSAAWSFYACARWLRLQWEWAMAGALFAFTFQTFNRGLQHLLIAFSWSVPLAILSVALVASSRRIHWRSKWGAVVLVSALGIGVSNPYLLFLYLQLMGLALLAHLAGGRWRAENVQVGAAALALALAALALVQAHPWLYATDTAADSPLERNYGGTEMYALKPLELAVPPATHRWEPMGFFGQRYH